MPPPKSLFWKSYDDRNGVCVHCSLQYFAKGPPQIEEHLRVCEKFRRLFEVLTKLHEKEKDPPQILHAESVKDSESEEYEEEDMT